MEAKKIALFDMDGTLCNFNGSMAFYLKKINGPNDPPLESMLSWDDEMPDYIDERRQLIMRQPNFWRHLRIIRSGIMLLDSAIKIGFDVHVLTKGPSGKEKSGAWQEKVDWCKENLPEDVKITITEDKSTTYGRVLVDDYPVYAEGWLKWRPRGKVLMPSYECNKDFEHPNVVKYDPDDLFLDDAIKVLEEAYER